MNCHRNHPQRRRPSGSCAVLSAIVAVMLSGPWPVLQGAEPPSKTKDSFQRSGTQSTDSQDIRAAMGFAKQHHPELATLLTRLKETSPAGFHRGVREVHRSAQRLERLRERHPARYEAELNRWKMDSRIRLMTARWIVSKDPALEQQILELLRQRRKARLDRLTTDREKLTARLQQIDRQIASASQESSIDQEWQRLQKRVASMKKKNRRMKRASPPTQTETTISADAN